MSHTHDRRAPGAARIPFDAMVEVGGALGPSFEAQAVNLSEEGMSLRTAYLPEVGQPVMCRFDAGRDGTFVAAGEVLWREDIGGGGEFGIRFTNLDTESATTLSRLLDGKMAGAAEGLPTGQKVRLHIEGLASPMRARIKEQQAAGVTAYSELGFLQMGKPLDLEDAANGHRRPARIDRVEVALDEASRIPQLVVSLRYDDVVQMAEPGSMQEPVIEDDEELLPPAPAPKTTLVSEAAAEPEAAKTTESELHEEGDVKASFAEKAKLVGPAIASFAKRAKTAATLLAARARRKPQDEGEAEVPVRRTTAPAPGGGLHAEGRKVVRGATADEPEETEAPKPRIAITRKRVAIGASVMIATVLVALAMRKPAPPAAAAAPVESASAVAALALPEAPPAPKPVPPPADPLASAAAAVNAKPGKIVPFTNGPVGSHPTVLKIKMDGPVEGIQGAPQPTGFTLAIPNRKSVEPTASLADKDGRIAAIQVSNEPSGAELSVSFKDGVPNYLVRAHGDTLELVLAKASAHGEKTEAHASKKKAHGSKKR